MPNLLTVASIQLLLKLYRYQQEVTTKKRIVFLDNMIIWNDKLEENFWGNELVGTDG